MLRFRDQDGISGIEIELSRVLEIIMDTTTVPMSS